MNSLLEEQKQDVGNPTNMVHIRYLLTSEPNVAVCGAKIRGITWPVGTPIDCIVCLEIVQEKERS